MSNIDKNAQKEIPDFLVSLFESFPYPLQIFPATGRQE